MDATRLTLWALIGLFFFSEAHDVHAVEEEKYPDLVFCIPLNIPSAMTYGFELLEYVHQARIDCMQEWNEVEKAFTKRLMNWTKYSIATEQLISQGAFDGSYRERVEENLNGTYKELFTSRESSLQRTQTACDNTLEKILQHAKASLLARVANLMEKSPRTLEQLISELTLYKTQLQEGVQKCLKKRQELRSKGLTARLNSDEELCYAHDADIVIVFLKQVLHLIAEEQSVFFEDDEELAYYERRPINENPCASSGCGDTEYPESDTEKPLVEIPRNDVVGIKILAPESRPTEAITRPMNSITHPYLSSNTNPPPAKTTAPPTRPPHTQPPHTPPTRPPYTPPTRPQHMQATTEVSRKQPIENMLPNTDQPMTDAPSPDTEQPTNATVPLPDSTTPPATPSDSSIPPTTPSDSNTLPTTLPSKPDPTYTPATSANVSFPDWLEDAFNNVLGKPRNQKPKSQKTVPGGEVNVKGGGDGSQATVDVKVDSEGGRVTIEGGRDDDEEDSHSHRHGEKSNKNDNEDSRSGTGGTNTPDVVIDLSPYFSDDADKQQVQGGHEEEEDGNSDSVELYHILIYIFTAVGCLMVVSTVVVVVAILVVRKRRRQLVDLELLTRTEKIASMKQNGYINPTYKFFEECNDS